MNQFPDLHQAVLDDQTLAALFQDVASLGADVEVTPKGRSRQQVDGASMTLSEARAALCGGAIQAVQLRYDHEGDRWCDTLMPAENGWRLTRINLAQAASIVAD